MEPLDFRDPNYNPEDNYDPDSPQSNPNHIKASTDFVRNACATCGIAFFMPMEYHTARQADHKPFHCPSGHPIKFPEPAPAVVVETKPDMKNTTRLERRITKLLAENDQIRAENQELKKKE